MAERKYILSVLCLAATAGGFLVWYLAHERNECVEPAAASTTTETFRESVPASRRALEHAPRAQEPVLPGPPVPDAPAFSLIQPEGPDPSSMAFIMGQDAAAGMEDRVKPISTLGNDLTRDEINSLYRLMAKHEGQDPLHTGPLNVLKNEAAEVLLRQTAMPLHYAGNLVAMFLDSGYDPVWRDYCEQFLGRSFSRQTHADKMMVARCLWHIVESMNGPIAGTALIALQRNAGDSGIARQQVKDLSYRWLTTDGTHQDIVITALQVSAEMGDQRILAAARTFAATGSLRTRISAIAAIGQLGEHSDRALLEMYIKQGNATVRGAAKAALKRLRS